MNMIEEPQRVRVMEGQWSTKDVIREVVESGTQEDPFYVMDLGELVNKYRNWKKLMPCVEPFYATTCNDDKVLIQTLAALGAGFDCASKADIELVTSLGVPPESIIFANAVKLSSHIRYASEVNVHMMTFDSVGELHKIKKYMPDAKIVLHVRCDASVACLRDKYGCDPVTEGPGLLKLAADIGLKVIGIAFHVGSDAEDPVVYARGVKLCRALFDAGAAVGHHMHLVVIGEGFSGLKNSCLIEAATVINAAIEYCFPATDVRVIADPGWYFATTVSTLAAMVFAIKDVPSKERDGKNHRMYYINDGMYRSFRSLIHAPLDIDFEPLNPSSESPIECSVWGPTCDSQDYVVRRTFIPPMALGDWLVFPNRGAYGIPLETRFNGFPGPKMRHVIDLSIWSEIRDIMPSSVLFTEPAKSASEVSSESAYKPVCESASEPASGPVTEPASPTSELINAPLRPIVC